MLAEPRVPGVALVVGAGDATGGAIARRFAREGLVACVTRRSADKLQPLLEQIAADGGQAFGFASDARKEEDVVALIERIETTIGAIEVLVFNIGANAPGSILEETASLFQDLGDGLFGWFPKCARSGQTHGRARRQRPQTNDYFYRRHRVAARRRQFRGVRRRQTCLARIGAKHGA